MGRDTSNNENVLADDRSLANGPISNQATRYLAIVSNSRDYPRVMISQDCCCFCPCRGFQTMKNRKSKEANERGGRECKRWFELRSISLYSTSIFVLQFWQVIRVKGGEDGIVKRGGGRVEKS